MSPISPDEDIATIDMLKDTQTGRHKVGECRMPDAGVESPVAGRGREDLPSATLGKKPDECASKNED